MSFNNYNSIIGSQVLGTQNNFASTGNDLIVAREELSKLLTLYTNRTSQLTPIEQQQLAALSQLQAEITKSTPEKYTVSKLLSNASGISGIFNIAEKISSWLTSLS